MTIVFAGKVIATAQKLVYIKCGGAVFSAAVTPSANRNSYRVAILFCINTQGRGASPLNPGL